MYGSPYGRHLGRRLGVLCARLLVTDRSGGAGEKCGLEHLRPVDADLHLWSPFIRGAYSPSPRWQTRDEGRSRSEARWQSSGGASHPAIPGRDRLPRSGLRPGVV